MQPAVRRAPDRWAPSLRSNRRLLNQFAMEKRIQSVLDFGCGDGRQAEGFVFPFYVGLDVSEAAVHGCRERFGAQPNRVFYWYDGRELPMELRTYEPDLSLSLDVIFHLVEDSIFEQYMRTLFGSGADFVAIYSTNGTFPDPMPHVRHWHFTLWVAEFQPEWVSDSASPKPVRGSREKASRVPPRLLLLCPRDVT